MGDDILSLAAHVGTTKEALRVAEEAYYAARDAVRRAEEAKFRAFEDFQRAQDALVVAAGGTERSMWRPFLDIPDTITATTSIYTGPKLKI